MIAGANSENLLFVLETQRKGEGVIDTMRKELVGLGYDAKAIGPAIAVGAEAGIAEILKLSRTIDISSKADVLALRANAQAVRDLAQSAGVAPVEVQKLATAEAVLEARMKAATQEARSQAAQITGLGNVAGTKMAPQVRTAANAMSALSLSAAGFTGGGQAAAMTAANVAQSLAALSSSAAIAASATGIGALVVVLSTVLSIMKQVNDETETMGSRLVQQISKTTDLASSIKEEADARNLLAAAQQRVRQAESATRVERAPGVAGLPDIRVLTGASLAEKKAVTDAQEAITAAVLQQGQIRGRLRTKEADKAMRKAEEAAIRLAEKRKRDGVKASDLETAIADDLFAIKFRSEGRLEALSNNAAEKEFQHREKEIRDLAISEAAKTNLIKDAYQVRIAAQEENHQKQVLLEQGYQRATRTLNAAGGTVKEQYDTRVADIEAEAAADIRAGQRREDVEARTQAKIRQLRKDTMTGAVRDLKTIEDATINSKNREIHAIGVAAMVLRKIQIGAQAAQASVESARAFAKVPGALAAQDYLGAALWAASGAQLGAAAALGFKEALGGGGGSSAGGGAGSAGGGSDRSTFEPRSSANNAGNVTINLITKNPHGRDEIQSTIFEINRAGILKTPGIQIPPTSGVVTTGVH